eukprot:266424-Rhodomonas_salina.1
MAKGLELDRPELGGACAEVESYFLVSKVPCDDGAQLDVLLRTRECVVEKGSDWVLGVQDNGLPPVGKSDGFVGMVCDCLVLDEPG